MESMDPTSEGQSKVVEEHREWKCLRSRLGSGARCASTAFLCEAMAGTDTDTVAGEIGRGVFLAA
jgi:hypothetical protein